MIWVFLLLTLCTLVGVLALVLRIAVYPQFLRTPEKTWQTKVMKIRREAFAKATSARDQLRSAAKEHATQIRLIRDAELHRHLASVPVEALQGYSGIGEGTTAALRGAGLETLAAVMRMDFQLRGFGPKRMGDLAAAVSDQLAKAQSRFDRGECLEAKSMARQVQEIVSRQEEAKALAQARLEAAQAVIGQLSGILPDAEAVTFLNYLLNRDAMAIPAQTLRTPLPDLERTLSAAEARALGVLRSKRAVVFRAVPETKNQATPAPMATRQSPATKTAMAVAPTVTETHIGEAAAEAKMAALECSVQLLYAAARADGRIAKGERARIASFLAERFGGDAAADNRIRALCAHYERGEIALDRCLRRLSDLFVPEQRSVLLNCVREVASVSSSLGQKELAFLDKVSARLGVKIDRPCVVAEVGEPAQTSGADAAAARACFRRLLDIDEETPLTAGLVRRQFNLLNEKYAPGRFDGMGPEFVEMAKGKLAEVRAAAEALLGDLGEKLTAEEAKSAPAELRHNPDLDAVFGG